MAEKAKEQPKDINLEMDNLTAKGKIHAEQYNNLKIQKIQHQVEIEKIDVLLAYYTKIIPTEVLPEDQRPKKETETKDK